MRWNGIFLAMAMACVGGSAWGADPRDEEGSEPDFKKPQRSVTLSVPMN